MSTTEEKTWQHDLPDCEDIARRFLFAIDEAAEAQDYNRLAEIEDRLNNLKRAHTDSRKSWEEETARVMAEKGDKKFQVGNLIYKHHTPKTIKCRSHKDTLDAVMEATGGDFSKIPDMLASGAWKPGSVRTVVGKEKYDELFHEQRSDKVQIQGRESQFTKG